MYVEEFASSRRMLKLLDAMKIDPKEDITNHTAICLNGFLKVYHQSYANMKHKKRKEIISIFSDFKVIKLYNSTPSDYDQEHYRNVMCDIFKNTNYKTELKKLIVQETGENDDDEYESE